MWGVVGVSAARTATVCVRVQILIMMYCTCFWVSFLNVVSSWLTQRWDEHVMMAQCSPGWNGWLILLLQRLGWGTESGSGLCGNWLTDGILGREACEVSGLMLRLMLCPRHVALRWSKGVSAWPYSAYPAGNRCICKHTGNKQNIIFVTAELRY